MASACDISLEFVLSQEGRHNIDQGGDTWFGISRRAYPDLSWPPTREQAIAIYRRDYWNHPRLRLERIKPLPVQMVLFDGAVQHGQVTMARLFQAELNRLGGALRIAVDGDIGPQTRGKLAAITQFDRDREVAVAQALLWARARLYRAIAAKPGQLGNLRGWLGRIAALGELLILRQMGAS
jgi:lysozyme family protein